MQDSAPTIACLDVTQQCGSLGPFVISGPVPTLVAGYWETSAAWIGQRYTIATFTRDRDGWGNEVRAPRRWDTR